MGAPRRSTPPRSAGRGRKKSPVTRDRSVRTRTGPQRRKRQTSPRKGGKSGTRSRSRAQARGQRSFIAKMAFMALLGYALVLSVDVLPRLIPDDAGLLWDKLVDRWLDNDVPRVRSLPKASNATKASKRKTATPRTTSGTKSSMKPTKPKVGKANITAKAKVKTTRPRATPVHPRAVSNTQSSSRADFAAPRPDAYARESRSLGEEKKRNAKQRRRRLDRLIHEVTEGL